MGVNPGAPERYAASAPLVEPIVQLLNDTNIMRCGNPVVTNIRKQIQITKNHTPTTSKVSKDDGSIVLSIQIMMFYITGDLSEEMLFYCLLEQSVFGNHFYWDCGHYSQLYVTSSIWKQSPYCSCCTCSVYIITCHQII